MEETPAEVKAAAPSDGREHVASAPEPTTAAQDPLAEQASLAALAIDAEAAAVASAAPAPVVVPAISTSGMTEEEQKEVQRVRMEALARLQGAKEHELTKLLLEGDKRGLTLMKNISAATFDQAVEETLELFEDMSTEDAIQDAIEQFESQGVDLSDHMARLKVASKSK